MPQPASPQAGAATTASSCCCPTTRIPTAGAAPSSSTPKAPTCSGSMATSNGTGPATSTPAKTRQTATWTSSSPRERTGGISPDVFQPRHRRSVEAGAAAVGPDRPVPPPVRRAVGCGTGGARPGHAGDDHAGADTRLVFRDGAGSDAPDGVVLEPGRPAPLVRDPAPPDGRDVLAVRRDPVARPGGSLLRSRGRVRALAAAWLGGG